MDLTFPASALDSIITQQSRTHKDLVWIKQWLMIYFNLQRNYSKVWQI